MEVKRKALLMSIAYLVTQVDVAIVLYFSGVVRDPGTLMVFTVFVGFLASMAYTFVPFVRMAPGKVSVGVMVGVAVVFLFYISREMVDRRLLLGLAALAAILSTALDARDLEAGSGGEASFLPLFARLSVPQICVAAVAAAFVL